MNFKKILALVLVMALTAAVTFGATLAFLTDETETKHNVFTSGKVNIDLTEITENDGVDVSTANGAEYLLVAPGDTLTKRVIVTNEGNIPAYVAVTVKLNNAAEINEAIDEYYEAEGYTSEQIQAVYDKVFQDWGLNYSKDLDGDGVNDAGMRLTITGDDMPEYTLQVDSVKTIDEYALFYNSNWFGDNEDIIPFDEYYTKDMDEYEIKYTYYIYLPAGEKTTLFEGLNVPEDFTNEQMAMFDGLEIDISGAAIQADNFSDAKSAFEALAAEMDDGTVYVRTAEALVEALESGKDVQLVTDVKIDPASMSNAYGKTGINVKNGQTIDGNGNTIDIKGAGGTWDSGINTTGGTIKNITITGSFRGIFINHNSTHSEPVVLENVTIDGTIYTISCDQGLNQTLIATNSTFKGWTSYAATLGEATFTGCYFGEGNGYAFCRPYAPTTFVGCDFEAGYEMDPRAAVTFENCTIGGVALTAENLATLVTSNIENATVK